jgi:uncharacterized iron-regulated membrane protein
MLRRALVVAHRWFGLLAATFLFVAGLTGTVIAWDEEIDAWLNPRLFVAPSATAPLPATELARRIEASDPRARVTYLPLSLEPGRSFVAYVQPRTDPATGQPFALDHDQVMADPATGDILGRREFGAVSLRREHLVPFLYELHYSLQLPTVGGFALGTLFMGGLAIAWVIDTLVALWISFPSAAAWRRSFSFRWTGGSPKLTFDLHRSGGTWLFGLVLVIAVTSVAMNLNAQVMRPLVSWFSPVTPSAFERAPDAAHPVAWTVTLPQAVAIAEAEAARRGWTRPAGGAAINPVSGVYGVGFFEAGRSHGDGGLGNPWVYVDAGSGALLGVDEPGRGSAGDVFLQAMFPLHSGRILGLAGRIVVTVMGLAVAMFSVTGVLVWARRRRARRLAGARPRPSSTRLAASAPT